MAAFGLRNQRGSCWINATLQALYRIPNLQDRYINDKADSNNPVETCIQEIWNSEGDDGLKSFYECVKTAVMPAGDGIGDSHELLEFICDKIPFIDNLLRFKVAHTIKCNHCKYNQTKPDSIIEFSINPEYKKQEVVNTIISATAPVTIDDWKCEKCGGVGCTKQMLFGSFPRVLTFHMTSLNTSANYSSILEINNNRYALIAVICFNGSHWWTYGRNMPPGHPWIEFNDNSVTRHDPRQFPVSENMRLLMYYRLNE
jgi:uncharacterized UBP type Zn finger protein